MTAARATIIHIPVAPTLWKTADLPTEPVELPLRLPVSQSGGIASSMLALIVAPFTVALGFEPFILLADGAAWGAPLVWGLGLVALAVSLFLAGATLYGAVTRSGVVEITDTGIHDPRVLLRELPWSAVSQATTARDFVGMVFEFSNAISLKSSELGPYLRPGLWNWSKDREVTINLTGHDASKIQRLAEILVRQQGGRKMT